MYNEFYGFKEKPFHMVPNPNFLYLTSKHQNALTYLEYGLVEGAGFILLTGEIGTGKTTLIKHILNETTSDMEVAVIFNTNVTSDQLLILIANEFELTPMEDKASNIDQLYQFLINKFAANKRVLLIIDEAQNLSDDVLEEVRMLSNLQTDNQILLQIMLVGQPDLKTKLKQPHLSQFAQRIAVNYHLGPLDRDETGKYISYRLEKAGGKPDIFTHEAIDITYKASHGIPRIINLLCETALVYGFADEIKSIDTRIIEQVIHDKGEMGFFVDNSEDTTVRSDITKENGEISSGRLESLEVEVQKLRLQMEWQLDELTQRADGYKDELVNKLKGLLLLERKQSDRLLISYSKLKGKYALLIKDLKKENNISFQLSRHPAKQNLTMGKNMVRKDTEEKNTGKPGMHKRLKEWLKKL